MPTDYFVWAIQGGGRTFIVDTGFNQEMAPKRKRRIVHPVEDGIKAIGIDPCAVDNVIITHLHDDHAGNRHQAGGHTRGTRCERINTKRGWVVLASDASHYYANFEEYRPFPFVADVTEMLNRYDRMRKLASCVDHIIPGHDPMVLERYSPTPGGAADIVRLDLPPKH